jgi:hypothetical protein
VYQSDSKEKGVVYEVPVTELDKIYPNATNITAIKIDVENFEYEVLSSARNLLERNMPIIYCELWNNEKRVMVFDYLEGLNYGAYTYDDKTASLVAVVSETECADNNFFFRPLKAVY